MGGVVNNFRKGSLRHLGISSCFKPAVFRWKPSGSGPHTSDTYHSCALASPVLHLVLVFSDGILSCRFAELIIPPGHVILTLMAGGHRLIAFNSSPCRLEWHGHEHGWCHGPRKRGNETLSALYARRYTLVSRLGSAECRRDGRGVHRIVFAGDSREVDRGLQELDGGALAEEVRPSVTMVNRVMIADTVVS